MDKLGLVFVFFLIAQSGRPHHHERMNIDVYFETLCPDSYNFIKYQLHPAWKYFKNKIHIRFIPFGKSRSVANGTRFHCQHGPRECEGNKIVSCALNYLSDQNDQMKYVNCFMTVFKKARQNRDEFGEKCADEVGLNFDYIRYCYTSQQGTDLQLEAETMTKRIQPSFVPTVVYNGMYDQFLQDASQTNFRLIACSMLSKNHGLEC